MKIEIVIKLSKEELNDLFEGATRRISTEITERDQCVNVVILEQ